MKITSLMHIHWVSQYQSVVITRLFSYTQAQKIASNNLIEAWLVKIIE